MICCRNVKISASIAARDRNRSTIAQTMSLTRSLITEQHRPILGQPPVNGLRQGQPVEQPARFRQVLNLKAAKTLGLRSLE
jgi:hypothetical protein